MSRMDWLAEYLAALEEDGATVRLKEAPGAPAPGLEVSPADWGRAARTAARLGWRWAGVWGDPMAETCRVRACLAGHAGHLLLETEVPQADPELASHTPQYPAADRMERHAQDLLGLRFACHPDPRRWTRHQAWPAQVHPLRDPVLPAGRHPGRTPADHGYPFRSIQGAGVYEIPVGPVHAGIIEPGHFRFQAVGEDVLRLEQRLGYVHKGIEQLARGRAPAELARLAGRVSGDSTVAHTWAACQAMEQAAGCAVPPRALHLRALLAERERVANHLGDIGAICNDVGFAFAHLQCAHLRERWQRCSGELFGHRLLMDAVIPGGVARDLPAGAGATLGAEHQALREAAVPVFAVIEDHPPLEDRLLGTGCLSLEDARALGCTGYVAKASGLDFDLRRDRPYAPYDGLAVEVALGTAGDVFDRVRVRMEEVHISLDLMDRLLATLPGGAVCAELPAPPAGVAGLGLVEGWRGETLSFVRFDSSGRVARYFPRDPSWFLWPALERLLPGNIVPDFPVCNKSVNASYSGHDL